VVYHKTEIVLKHKMIKVYFNQLWPPRSVEAIIGHFPFYATLARCAHLHEEILASKKQ